MNTKYITDSKLNIIQERQSEEDALKQSKILKKWKVTKAKGNEYLCGNIRASFKDGIATIGECDESATRSNKQISSALALYRAVSLFKCGCEEKTQDYYKCNWSVTIKHKLTGKLLMLGEWKGGFQIFTEASGKQELPREFIKDVEEFLTFFVSNRVAIGYDGVIAGSVA